MTEVVPGSPAEASGLQPGDLLIYLVRTDGPRDAYLKRPQVHARDQGALEAWLETQAPGLEVQAWALRNGRMLRNAVRLAPAPGAGAGPLGAGHAPGPMETAQKAYLQMCGKGDEKLGAATCASMKRDLDAALAREAAEAREAEVMALHRRLCAPDARKLSVETCAAMLTEAERTLAAAPALSPKDFSSASAKGASAPPARRGRGPSPAPP
ncbi:hypothetical protein LRS04_16665 [Phenylobacterium sp. J367]|nr:hypothetical protein [Phenylobacterium sp. J367]